MIKKFIAWWDRKQAEWVEKERVNLRKQRKKEQAKQLVEIRSAQGWQEGFDLGLADQPLEEGCSLEAQAGWIAGWKTRNKVQ